MDRARINWGEADIFINPKASTQADKPALGGPVHQQLNKRRADKLARRARREQQRVGGGS